MEHTRAPLRDIAVNSPSLKRQKLNSNTQFGKSYLNDQDVETLSKRYLSEQQIQDIEEQVMKQDEHQAGYRKQLLILKIAEVQKQEKAEQAKEEEKKAHTEHHHHQQQQDLQSIPLPEWQRKWRKILRESVIYFDSNDLSVSEGSKKKDKERAIKMFTQVGATIQPFFDHRVTIFVTNRAKSELPRKIQTQPQSINAPHPLKFWNYEKVFRFLKHLGEVSSPEKPTAQHQAKHLSVLLQNEKLHGTNDRDPNAKRDDFNYFKHPHFYVYDLRQVIKPVALREWKVKETSSDKKPWPHLYESSYGHSLFQADPSNINDARKRERRKLRDEQNKDYRDRLKLIYSTNPADNKTMFSESEESEECETSYIAEDDQTENITQMPPPRSNSNVNNSLVFPPNLARSNSVLMNKFIESNKRDNFEIEASGYNGSTNNSNNQSNEFSKNGLVATTSTVHSKEIGSLHRRLIEKKSKLTQQEKQQLNHKAKVAGYCENCRIHFDDFDEHSYCSSHRAFAMEDSNFSEIDDLIMKLHENIYNKKV